VPGGQQYYDFFFLGLCLVALIAVYLVAERLRRSPFGRVLRAVRDDMEAARAFGRDVFRFQLKAFMLGGAIAGLGGALLVHFIGGFNPAGWSFAETFLIYASVFLGGSGNNRGVVIGAVLVIGVINEATRLIPQGFISGDQLPALQAVASGALMIGILRWRPAGILVEPIYRDPDALAGPR
jgi:ABC-type branched-subunit amino acid transport system permease subunit